MSNIQVGLFLGMVLMFAKGRCVLWKATLQKVRGGLSEVRKEGSPLFRKQDHSCLWDVCSYTGFGSGILVQFRILFIFSTADFKICDVTSFKVGSASDNRDVD